MIETWTKKVDSPEFEEFLKKEYPDLSNEIGLRYYDESWTDYQARCLAEKAFKAGFLAGAQLDKILLEDNK